MICMIFVILELNSKMVMIFVILELHAMISMIFEILAYDLRACAEGLENSVQEGEIVENTCEFLGAHINDFLA